MKRNKSWRERMFAEGRCTDCARPKETHLVRCNKCAESHRARNRNGPARRKDWYQTETADELAERQAFKKGGALLPEEGPVTLAEPIPSFTFIRSQTEAAVPLLARLYAISEARVWEIRGRGGKAKTHNSERMPLRLLEELVEQRTGKYCIDHFIRRESPIAACMEHDSPDAGNLRDRRSAEGLCIDCGSATPGIRCDACNKKNAMRAKLRYDERRLA